MLIAHVFIGRHNLAERYAVRDVFNRFEGPANGRAGKHHSPGCNAAGDGGLCLRNEIVFQRTMNAEMAFRVDDAWENIVSLRIDSFLRREAAQIGCDGGDLFALDPNTRRYYVRRNNQLSIVDY